MTEEKTEIPESENFEPPSRLNQIVFYLNNWDDERISKDSLKEDLTFCMSVIGRQVKHLDRMSKFAREQTEKANADHLKFVKVRQYSITLGSIIQAYKQCLDITDRIKLTYPFDLKEKLIAQKEVLERQKAQDRGLEF